MSDTKCQDKSGDDVAASGSTLAERMKACAFYDFDSIEMVECKWAMWEEILNFVSRAALSQTEAER